MGRTPNAQKTIEHIIEVSARLFAEKGYDRTTMQEIVEVSGISKGAIFHHFDSKEEIAEAVVERLFGGMVSAAEKSAADKSLPIGERLVKTILALQVSDGDGLRMLRHLHSPQNALIHLKMEKTILEKVTPILAGIAREGIEQGIFHTRYPEEVVEMILCYANNAFDAGRMTEMSLLEMQRKAAAFTEAIERLTGAEKGSMDILTKVIIGKDKI